MAHEVRHGYVGNGALFKSPYKERPSHCDYNGDCELDGRFYRIRGWVKSDKNGGKFLSLGFQPMNVPPGEGDPMEPRELE